VASSPADGALTATWHTVLASNAIRVNQLLQEFIVTELECRPLRVLLGEVGRWQIQSLDRQRLLDEVARMVADRRLTLRERLRGAGSPGASVAAHGERPAPGALACTPAQLWRQQVANPTVMPAVVDPEFAEVVEQDFQARVLRAAAAQGTPFCEMCEKARRAAAHDPSAPEA